MIREWKISEFDCVSGDLGLISFSVMYFEREQLKSEYNYVELRTGAEVDSTCFTRSILKDVFHW